MAINLLTTFSKDIQTIFVRESLVASKISSDFKFMGAKTVEVLTPVTQEMNDYKRTGTNRYGDPKEMEDIVQELTCTQDKSFSITIDKGNYHDQGMLKKAARMLGLQMKERAIPLQDQYMLAKLANDAGTIIGNGTKLTKSNIVEQISLGTQALDDAEVPAENRTLFINSANYRLLRHSDEFMKVENLADKSLSKGVVALYDNMQVVKVPAGRWPKNLNFLIVHKNAAVAPVKLDEAKIHEDPPGISGSLLEGRQYYDLFVFGAKSGGVYAEVDTSAGGVVCATPTQASGTFSSTTDGCTFKYTTDGSDPRYSKTAVVGASESAPAGTIIKVYAYKTGAYPSPVFTYTAAD